MADATYENPGDLTGSYVNLCNMKVTRANKMTFAVSMASVLVLIVTLVVLAVAIRAGQGRLSRLL